MNRISCDEMASLAPELAFGVLPGRERAAACVHLETCAACRAAVGELGGLVDELLTCGPTAQPPAGFEQQVLARLSGGGAAEARPRPRRRLRPLAAAAALVAAAMAWMIGTRLADPSEITVEAAMRTGGGEVVGSAMVSGDDDSAALEVAVPEWADQLGRYGDGGGGYSVHVDLVTGDDLVVPFDLADGASWTLAIPGGVDAVAAVTMVDADGNVLCNATFVDDGRGV